MTIRYMFRKPKFPIICILDDMLITAKSDAELQSRLNSVTLMPDTRYNTIDSSGATWELSTNQMYIAPTLRRKWSKKKIIQTYNGSRNCKNTRPYSEKSLSSKRFEVIFSDIVELIEQSQ